MRLMFTSQDIHLVGKASGHDKVNKEGTEGTEIEMCERHFIIYENNFLKSTFGCILDFEIIINMFILYSQI